MVMSRRSVPCLLALVWASSACDPAGSIQASEDAISFSAEAENLWSELSPGPEGEGLVTPVFEASHAEFDRVGVRFDATDTPELEARVRTNEDGAWSEWAPIEITFREEIAHNGYADLPHGGSHVQLRVQSEDAEALSFLAVHAFDARGEDVLDDGVITQGLATRALATSGAVDVRRSGWGARSSRCSAGIGNVHRAAIHHTDTPNNDPLSAPARMRQMQNFHMDARGWCDIGYHFVVGLDGRVYEARPEHLRGAHVGGENAGNVGIALVGNYESTLPTTAMREAAAEILGAASDKHGFPLDRNAVQGHREWSAGSSCPGDTLLRDLPDLVALADGGEESGGSQFVLPVPSGGVVLNDGERHFGACRSADGGPNSDCTREHLGVDIHAKIGTPVVAAADGVVVERSTNSGAGLFLNIEHADGYVTRYLHLDRTRGVSVGSSVEKGQRIGDVGETGRAGSGPHLHFEVRDAGEPIDPAPFIGWDDLPRVDVAPDGSVEVPPGGDTSGSRGLLNPGDRGIEVYRLQHLLEAWRPGIMGADLGGVHTATYGPRTLEAVHEAAGELRGHQNPSDDYTVGPLFWGALVDAINDRFSGSIRLNYQDSGSNVYRLQHALEAWRPGVMGGSLGSIDSANYGSRTQSAIHEAARELRGHDSPNDDYTVGPRFWSAVLTAIQPTSGGGDSGGGDGGGGDSGGDDGSGGDGDVLNPGDSGSDVYRLQHLLEAWQPGVLGGSLGGVHTATYGPRTLAAVHDAAGELRDHQNPSDDYTVGPLFWGAVADAVRNRFSGSVRLNYQDSGPDVYRLQHALEAWRPGILGGALGGVDTATYGPRTREAVHEAARELRGHDSPNDDYTVGPQFWDALLTAIE